MAKCMNEGCNNELTGRQRSFCSDKCRKAQSRTEKTNEDGSGQPKSDERGQNTHPNADKLKSDSQSRTLIEAAGKERLVAPDVIPKRGKDIRAFEDLPADVRRSIETMSSLADNKAQDKAKRAGIAIRYQHLFPARFC